MDFDELPDLAPGNRVSRNAPCPCGSGKKYKKCCLAKEAKRDLESIDHELHSAMVRPERFDDPELDSWKQADRSLGDKLMDACAETYGGAFRLLEEYWGKGVASRIEELPHRDGPLGEFLDWLALDYRRGADAPTVAEKLLKDAGLLRNKERRILTGMAGSVRSAYQVTRVEMDRGVELEDLLRGGKVFITDVALSRTAPRWAICLPRVYPAGPFTFLTAGWHCSRPGDKAQILEFFKRKRTTYNRKHKGASWEEFLKACPRLFAEITIELGAFDEPRMPVLKNMDGEDLVFCESEFEADDIDAALDELDRREDFEVYEQDGGRVASWRDTKPRAEFGGNPVNLGSVSVAGNKLTLECNSRKRMRRGKKILGSLPGVRHVEDRTRTFEDIKDERPLGLMLPPRAVPAELQELAKQQMQKYYEEVWINEPVPALGNRTPRELSRTARGRKRLTEFFRDMAFGESNVAAPYDFNRLRRMLGVEEE